MLDIWRDIGNMETQTVMCRIEEGKREAKIDNLKKQKG